VFIKPHPTTLSAIEENWVWNLKLVEISGKNFEENLDDSHG
jgi:hypothetical protein